MKGMIAGVEKALAIADENTRIIPGHGPLTDRKGLEAYHRMLVTARDRVQKLIDEGKSLEDAIAAKPMADYDEAWGKAFIKPEQFVTFVYRSLEPGD